MQNIENAHNPRETPPFNEIMVQGVLWTLTIEARGLIDVVCAMAPGDVLGVCVEVPSGWSRQGFSVLLTERIDDEIECYRQSLVAGGVPL